MVGIVIFQNGEGKYQVMINNSELLAALVRAGKISQETVDHWTQLLFYTPHEPGSAPWDPFMYRLWIKQKRDTFEDIIDFYREDCSVVFQGTMAGSWTGSVLSDSLKTVVKSNDKVLEYGSGGGREIAGCLKQGAKVTACDVSERLLEGIKLLAQENGYGEHLDTLLIREEVPSLPKDYDVIITIDCLEHVQKPIEVLKELISSLKTNGLLYIEVFFGGHEMSPYHLVENNYLGDPQTWYGLLESLGLRRLDTYLWQKI